MILPHWLNLRYVSVLFGPFYLLAGVGFWYAASVCWNHLGIFHRRVFAAVIILGLGIGASSDYRRYLDSVAACQKALQLRPDYAEAYNSLATAYVALEMWDEAIQAAQQALQLNPDLPLARDNLARSLDQKRLRDSVKPPTQ
jgi:tetratricopeptide (TPR) repeat protein